MGKTILSMRVDEDLKKQFCATCTDLGLSASAAITIFVKAVARQHRIPFEISASGDPLNGAAELPPLPDVLAEQPAKEAKPAKTKAPSKSPKGRR